MNCVLKAWGAHEKELRGFLVGRVHDPHLAEDLLQDTFLKALAEGSRFCQLDNARAWLFRVARNRLIDHARTHREYQEIPDQIPEETEQTEPVADLAQCLPRALEGLSAEDRDAIGKCDLEGMTQADYARSLGLSLAGAKSRIQRARRRLKRELHDVCRVRFDESGKICCFLPDTARGTTGGK